MRKYLFGWIAAAGLSVFGSVGAAEVVPVISSGSVSFTGGNTMFNGTLTVTGPKGYYEQIMSEKGLPAFRLQGAGRLVDGVYTYSLTAATQEREPVYSSENNGRGDAAEDTVAKSYSSDGAFRVANGLILTGEDKNAEELDTDQAD